MGEQPPHWVLEALAPIEELYDYVWSDRARETWLAVWVRPGGDVDLVGSLHAYVGSEFAA